MADSRKPCKYCGKPDLLWVALGPGRWALFEADAQGRRVRNHTAICKQRPSAGGVPSETDDTNGAVTDFYAAAEAQREADIEAATAITLKRYEGASGAVLAADVSSLIPAKDAGYLVDAAQWAAIKRVFAVSDETREPQNIAFWGEAGSGKTTLGIQCGAHFGRPTFVIDSTDKETTNDWFGQQSMKDGNLTVTETDFVRAIETPNAVIILDDVALIQARTVQNGLNALLDPSRRSIFVGILNRTLTVAPGVVFIGTWNVGPEYSGASELSKQLVDRFRAGAMFEVPYPDDGTLATIIRSRSACPKREAGILSDVAQWLRSDPEPVILSTRGLVAAGQQIRKGATIGAALFYTVFGEMAQSELQRVYGIIGVRARSAGYLAQEVTEFNAPETQRYVPLS